MCSIFSAGADGINVSSKERNGNVVAVEGSPVHPHCRKRYTDKRGIALFKRKSDEKLDTVTNRKSQRILSPTRDSINLNCSFVIERLTSIIARNMLKMTHQKFKLINLYNQS